ncbi:hypothetical protein D1007_20347 [Hordeum vulgare]|nr:hypothetical protein D1007_20347 [Hordeum vulgare]
MTVGFWALLQPPSIPPTPPQGWIREELDDPRLTPVLTRLERLKQAGVTMAMVVWEFIYRRIAPLQRHSRLIWAYTGPQDMISIEIMPLSSDVLCMLPRLLTGGNPDELARSDLSLYNFKASEALVAEMPLFDE